MGEAVKLKSYVITDEPQGVINKGYLSTEDGEVKISPNSNGDAKPNLETSGVSNGDIPPALSLDIDAERVLLAIKGRWRVMHFFVYSFFMLLTAFAMYGNVFMGVDIPHHCSIPENYNLSDSVPYKDGEPEKCLAYTNFSSLTNQTQPCPNGWTYRGDRHSILEWDLVCDKDILVATAQTILVTGVLCGAFIMPIFSDRFGRKTIMCISLVSIAILGVITSFVNNYVGFVILRFFTGVFQQGVVLTNFVIRTEMFPSSKRALVNVFGFTMFSIGSCLTALLGYAIHDWRHLILVYATPGFLGIVLYWFGPESPSWLVAKRRFKDVQELVERAMKWNDNPEDRAIAQALIRDLAAAEKAEQESNHHKQDQQFAEVEEAANYSILDIFKNKRLVTWALINVYLWCTTSLVYYGLSFLSGNLVDNFHFGFALSTAIEIPSGITTILCLQYIGRRWSNFLFFLVAGLSIVTATALDRDDANKAMEVSVVVFSLIGKYGITSTFQSGFVWSPELFPTTVRNIGVGLASSGGRIGNIAAPFSAYLAEDSPIVIGAIFGALSLGASLLALILPETRGRKLPLTIDEVNHWTRTISKEELEEYEHYQKAQKEKYKTTSVGYNANEKC